MSDTFKVGDIAIAVNWPGPYLVYEGTEVLIIGPLTMSTGFDRAIGRDTTDLSYLVQCNDGNVLNARPYELRRKPPADEGRTVTRWADCPWQPEKVRA